MVYGVPFYPWPLTGWGGQDFYGGIGPKLYTILTRFGGRWQTGGGWVDTPEEAIQVQVQDDLPETLYECVKLRAERIQPGVTLTRGLTASLKVRRLKAMFGLRHD